MRISIDVRVDDGRLFKVRAERTEVGPENDTYSVCVISDEDAGIDGVATRASFGELTSCGVYGIYQLIHRLVDFVLGPDGIVAKGRVETRT